MWVLALLFIVVPFVELALLLQLGAWLGPAPAFLLVVLTGIVGAWLAQREGLGVLSQLQGELTQGLPPGDRLVEGVMILVGGLLLVTPGMLTDLLGFSLIVPWTRRWMAPRILAGLQARVQVQGSFTVGNFGAPPPPGASSGEAPKVRIRESLGRSTPAPPPNPFANKFDDLP